MYSFTETQQEGVHTAGFRTLLNTADFSSHLNQTQNKRLLSLDSAGGSHAPGPGSSRSFDGAQGEWWPAGSNDGRPEANTARPRTHPPPRWQLVPRWLRLVEQRQLSSSLHQEPSGRWPAWRTANTSQRHEDAGYKTGWWSR